MTTTDGLRAPVGGELPAYSVVAHNYAAESENKIHQDSTARRYGFRGGLVPGVADYAYLTRPVLDALGRAWLERGGMSARFRRPVYDGDRVTTRVRVLAGAPPRLALELLDSAGESCATGEAWLDPEPPSDPAAWAERPLPDERARPVAGLGSLPVGTVLGTLRCGPYPEAEVTRLAQQIYHDHHLAYAGADAVMHPAHVLHEANLALRQNVVLGPWIHTGSSVRYFALWDWRRPARLFGKVAESRERGGNESVVLDFLLVDPAGQPLAHVLHSAIVKLREKETPPLT